jgi:phosphatidylglycerol lysyltransferase
MVGLFLIILSRGLFMRIALARSAAIVLLLFGTVFALAKGFDWEEAIILVVVAGALALFRDSFYRKADWRSLRPSLRWLSLVAITLISLTFIGSLAYRGGSGVDVWWQFAWQGDASRFVRATFAITVVIAAIAIDALINRPVRPHSELTPVPDMVRSILARCPTTQPMVALLGDKRFLVDDAGTAFLMYGISGRSWITMGDPVGDQAGGRELIWRFAELVDRAGGRPVFYEVGSEMLAEYIDLGLTILKVGEEAKVDLTTFSLEGAAMHGLRQADHRADRDGLAFDVIPRATVPARLPELRAVSDAWLTTKQAREKGFSLGRFDADYFGEFDCAVMLKDGEIVGFANIWRGAGKNEISPDLMRYRPGVSNALMEALFVRLMKYGQAEGYRWFNLGSVPLSGLSGHPMASKWDRVGNFVYRHADEFYNFEGLRAFKEKFSPVWTSQYLACPSGLALPRILLDITSLTSGGTMGIVKR